jgi:hypothetical protein
MNRHWDEMGSLRARIAIEGVVERCLDESEKALLTEGLGSRRRKSLEKRFNA